MIKNTSATNINESLFPELVELDSLRLTVIVDNKVDIMTSVPKELGQTIRAQYLFKDPRHLDEDRSTVPVEDGHGGHSHDGERDESKRG